MALGENQNPEGVDYLVDKYQLDRSETYYIGDRTLDVDLADNAGIGSINFLDYKPDVNHAIQRLDDIRLYFEEEKVNLFNKARLLCCWNGAMKRIRKQFVLKMK